MTASTHSGRTTTNPSWALMIIAGVAAVLTIVGLGACTSGPVEQTGAGTVVEVAAVDNVFKPETNEGRNNHDIVPVAANGNWGVALEEFGADAVYSHTFTEPGAYDYYCTVHGTKTRGMIGKVVVTE